MLEPFDETGRVNSRALILVGSIVAAFVSIAALYTFLQAPYALALWIIAGLVTFAFLGLVLSLFMYRRELNTEPRDGGKGRGHARR